MVCFFFYSSRIKARVSVPRKGGIMEGGKLNQCTSCPQRIQCNFVALGCSSVTLRAAACCIFTHSLFQRKKKKEKIPAPAVKLAK